MSLMSLGIVRGFIGQIAGTVIGIALAMTVRVMLGMPTWSPEPVWVTGIIFGSIGFLIGVGAVSDWFGWMWGKDTPLHHGPPTDAPAWTRYFSVDYNHKVIGIQYTVTAMHHADDRRRFAVIFRTELWRVPAFNF